MPGPAEALPPAAQSPPDPVPAEQFDADRAAGQRQGRPRRQHPLRRLRRAAPLQEPAPRRAVPIATHLDGQPRAAPRAGPEHRRQRADDPLLGRARARPPRRQRRGRRPGPAAADLRGGRRCGLDQPGRLADRLPESGRHDHRGIPGREGRRGATESPPREPVPPRLSEPMDQPDDPLAVDERFR